MKTSQSLYDFLKANNMENTLTNNKFFGAVLNGFENDNAANYKSISSLLLAKAMKADNESDEPDETYELVLNNGYQDIITKLAVFLLLIESLKLKHLNLFIFSLINGVNGQKKIKFLLNKIVKEIKINNGVEVLTKDGSSYTGDYAIVTVSLGVLKAGSIKFTPSLSQNKRTAISRAGFGVMNKVYLEFNENFMDKTYHAYIYIENDFNKRNFLNLIYNMGRITNKGTVMILTGSETGYGPVTQSDEYIKNKCFERLSTIFDKPVSYFQSNFKTMKRTKWSQDEFARGSYSFPAAGSTMEDIEELAKPHGKYILFAGEHTNFKQRSSVHGAYISGLNAACSIDNNVPCYSIADKFCSSPLTIVLIVLFTFLQ